MNIGQSPGGMLQVEPTPGAVFSRHASADIRTAASAPDSPASADEATVSIAAQMASRAVSESGEQSGVRTGMVSRIRGAIQDGSYQVSAHQVASSLITSMLER